MATLISKTTLDLINKDIVSNLLADGRIDDLKKIAICCGKNCQTTLNTESLRVLEIEMGAEYTAFYNNLKD